MDPQIWSCSRCQEMAQTVDAKIPMHHCKGMAGLLVPLTRQGDKTHQVVMDREDYVAGELVQCDANGRVVMAVKTIHNDGSEDCNVFAPTARLTTE
jgi:hypothetical protein